ncbi:MAG: AI-2E family transporter [Clostridia bacterium]|nr:AI-2E family transporter [Clostridia bacterium]
MEWERYPAILGTILLGIVLAGIAVWLLSHFLTTLLVIAFSALLAFIVTPAVDGIQRLVRWRGLAIALVLLVGLALFGGGLSLLSGPLIRQLTQLVEALPGWVARAQRELPQWLDFLARQGIVIDARTLQGELLSRLQSSASAILSATGAVASAVSSAVANIVLTLVLMVYWLLYGERIWQGFLLRLPRRGQPLARLVAAEASRALGGYFRGQVTLALIIGLLHGVGAWALGLPYSAIIGVLGGLFELVPMFGAVLGAIPGLLVALLQPQPFPLTLWVALYFLLVQQLEGNLLAPRITGHAVGVHPLTALIALTAGFEVAGLLGGLVAVPLVGMVASVLRNLGPAVEALRRGGEPTPPLPPTPPPDAGDGEGSAGRGGSAGPGRASPPEADGKGRMPVPPAEAEPELPRRRPLRPRPPGA